MILSYLHKGLKELFEKKRSAKIDSRMHQRIIIVLDALDQARRPEDMNIPGLDFHPLRGFTPTRYTVHIDGPWCVTFQFEGENAKRVNFEQYH
ncbi:MAG TPA: type II toxin-antitoxin system RelE/ParE family toxin [Xanthobacteraceae bacterium]|nr:type II toxin-antitoxin system RelE/ParE family toxin [Xanthobacteraceae bacterium]